MRFGSSIALIAIGAIIAFAVQDVIPGIDLTIAGYILMAAGALLLVLSLVQMGASGSRRRVTEARNVQDPDTGESITRRETRDY
ncbi:hypothetical protein E7744_00460 [Citricoccus sp. SGAir0253]|uniref:DUF6458 family protein n=1 Tax=Citricoccus sp. SGAir0253 TaxID=2567881 RepID=UPI0010CD60A4|nr:DUF6458 family protein [Citricoccus sp. SGAir0253]QCU76876.1 hypothetical protein E7744_00460 [Citricoccus sp. SGAir0253]